MVESFDRSFLFVVSCSIKTASLKRESRSSCKFTTFASASRSHLQCTVAFDKALLVSKNDLVALQRVQRLPLVLLPPQLLAGLHLDQMSLLCLLPSSFSLRDLMSILQGTNERSA